MAETSSAPEWRIVQDFPDYEVSNLGTVRRRFAHHTMPDRFPAGSPVALVLGGQFRKRLDGVVKDFRYVKVWLHCRERKARFQVVVSRLVCHAFHGAPPSEDAEAAHNDGDTRNNMDWNLRWDTAQGNQADRLIHGTHSQGSKHGASKLNEPLVAEILARLALGETQTDLGLEYGLPACTVDHLKHGRSWRHVPRPVSPYIRPINVPGGSPA